MKANFINVALRVARLVACASVLLTFCPASAGAQQRGAVTGRVVAEDGGGLANVTVVLNAVGPDQQGANPSRRATTITDEEGAFRFTDLPPRNYSVFVLSAKGYVPQPAAITESGSRGYYRIGDHVTFTMIRGGVITGRVTTLAGEPMIGAQVTAVMVKDFEGNPVRQRFGARSRSTDDRGVYRLYGLQPGTYLVFTGSNLGAPRISPYEGSAPTYYPSSPRETATEVTVASGGEATGIDIRHRGERGHTVSGTVTGGGASEQYEGASVTLYGLASGFVVGTGYVRQGEGQNGFAIQGVGDDEYGIVARRGADDKSFASAPQRVTVRGADVGGIALKLAPLASISGRIVVTASPQACENSRKSSPEEIIVSVRPDASATAEASQFASPQPDGAVSEKGEFTIHGLYPGRYFLEPRLPNENWYAKSLIAAPVAAAGQPSAGAKSAANKDVGRNGLAVKSGDRVAGLIVTVSDGAASLRGKVTAGKPGARLPERLRVHLIPAEAVAADDMLRYAETLARPDGSFAFSRLAPGRYRLLTRAAPEDDAPEAPEAWDGQKRALLRREAEAARQEVELQACQQLTDYVLPFKQK